MHRLLLDVVDAGVLKDVLKFVLDARGGDGRPEVVAVLLAEVSDERFDLLALEVLAAG
ncbi:hypothetical protein [Halobacterium wangiae]|uniref:hypothetical protein n=1 Tax=Halobacterium wangiae TaxID=2902623 RepID=UPI001E4F6960|nr:hypothetical protein [Halobacterium wangiae]